MRLLGLLSLLPLSSAALITSAGRPASVTCSGTTAQLVFAARRSEASMTAAEVAFSRRAALTGAAFSLTALSGATPVLAAQDPKDLTRLSKGLADINYLLDNWVKETTNPGTGAMDPDRVRLFLGLRTTTSPLFQVEKVLVAAQNKVDPDSFEQWIEAVEDWNSHLNKVNELAYTSSFGEYNPGGGKDQIAKYLDLAKAEVVLARDALANLISLLEL